MPRPLIAHIDLQALQHNVSRVRAYAPHSKIMAVIKANAYGHGMLRVAKALPVDGLAILTLEEALCLRGEGFNCPILMLEGVFSPDEWNILASQRISSVIHNQEQLHWLEKARMVLPVDIFLKVNTGMNRLGFNPHEIGLVYARLQACKHARLVTLMTHFAQADEERGVEDQLHVFEQVTYGLGCLESMANSAAIIRYPQSHKDWVRPGVMLYGASPFSGVNACSFDLRPVMTLESVLIAIQNLRKGQAVGYGCTWVANSNRRIGIVACGYADGYPRHAKNGTPVLVEGKRVPLVGRVSMDMLAVDVTDIVEAQVGSKVVLWGKGLPVEEVALASGTISYELLSALMPRVAVKETHF